MKRTLSVLAALLLAAALPAAAQDFTRFVTIGDSLTHGYMSGCVVTYGQTDSYGAIVARSTGATYAQSIISDPGLGGCMTLVDLKPTFAIKNPTGGKPINLAYPSTFNNLGISGYKVADVVDKLTDGGGLADTVLRGKGTVLQQAAAFKPTFVTVWIGNNDELGAVTSAIVVDGVTLTSRAAFKAKYDTILSTLKTAQGGVAAGVVFTLPDATSIPFSTTLPIYNITLGAPVLHKSGPFAGTPWRWTGSRDGLEIPFGSIVPLTASTPIGQGYGIACGMLDDAGYPAAGPLRAVCDKLPLPEGKIDATGPHQGYVIYADNVQKVVTRTAEFNADINALAATYGYRVFDAAAIFADIAKNGRKYGGMELKTAFLSGGIFGYDGVHPGSVGYAVLADEFIQYLNQEYTNPPGRPDMSVFLFNGNTSGGWFPLPQGQTFSGAEIINIGKELFNEQGIAGLNAVFPVTVTSTEIPSGDGSAPSTGARDAVSPRYRGRD